MRKCFECLSQGGARRRPFMKVRKRADVTAGGFLMSKKEVPLFFEGMMDGDRLIDEG